MLTNGKTKIVIAVGLLSCCGSLRGEELPSVESIVNRLKHFEGLVKTMSTEYTKTSYPTPASCIPLIKEARQRMGDENYKRYIFKDKRIVEIGTWHKGVKQRTEVSALDTNSVGVKVEAYDGAIVRGFNSSANQGVIGTPESEHFFDTNQINPMSFLYEYRRRPYSELIRAASDVSVTKEGGLSCLQFEVGRRTLRLLFDEDLLLRRRQFFKDDEGYERLWEQHEFPRYVTTKLPGGESIPFPKEAQYRYFAGYTENGTPAEYNRVEMIMKRIDFNKPIDDQKFVITFPPDATVRDKINGFGNVSASDLEAVKPFKSRSSFIWMLLSAVAICGVIYISWYKVSGRLM